MENPAIFDLIKNELRINNPPKPLPTIDDLMQEYNNIHEAIGGSKKYRSRFLKVVGKLRPHY
jgi:hypothetical protein